MTDFLGTETELAGNTGAQDNTSLVFDLSDVKEETGFEIIPKGTYPAVVAELDFGESSKGNPMITVQYEITEGEFEGRKLWDYWVLAGNGAEFGLGKLKKFLSRVVPEASLTSFNPTTFAESGDAVNREVSIVVKVQTQKKGDYAGEKRNQVSDVLAPEFSSGGSFL